MGMKKKVEASDELLTGKFLVYEKLFGNTLKMCIGIHRGVVFAHVYLWEWFIILTGILDGSDNESEAIRVRSPSIRDVL